MAWKAQKVVKRPQSGVYKKSYAWGSVVAHLAAQRPKTQRLVAAAGREPMTAETGLVRWVKGRTLASLLHTKLVQRNKLGILNQLADIVAEHLRRGVFHGDIHTGNIVLSGKPKARMRPGVRMVDYELATVLSAKNLDMLDVPFVDYSDVIRRVVPELARDRREAEMLERHFRRTFLRKLEEKL